MDVTATPGTKMQFLISRRPGVTRDELAVNWFANHMPSVITRQQQMAARSGTADPRYIATLYNPVPTGDQVWDGVAQIWADAPFPREKTPHGTTPRDTFQQKAEPYVGWPTTEYVIVGGGLPLTPNDLNEPFPFTRSGFLKVTTLLTARADADHRALVDHWLNVHAPNVAGVMQQVGAFRYAVSISDEPTVDPYVGMAELYFPDKAALGRYLELYRSDGIEEYFDPDARLIFRSTTEMVGIP
ncbi:MAG: EthD domain-containing protein [Actinomycetota bacterium]